mgnify:CR=1 FL=1
MVIAPDDRTMGVSITPAIRRATKFFSLSSANTRSASAATIGFNQPAAAIAIPQQWQFIEQTSQAPRQTIHRPGRQSADIGGANEQAAEEDAARFIEERMQAYIPVAKRVGLIK